MIEKMQVEWLVRALGMSRRVGPPLYHFRISYFADLHSIQDGLRRFTSVEMYFLNVYRLIRFVYVDT